MTKSSDCGLQVSTLKCLTPTRSCSNQEATRSSVCREEIVTNKTSSDGPQTLRRNQLSVFLRFSKISGTRSSFGPCILFKVKLLTTHFARFFKSPKGGLLVSAVKLRLSWISGGDSR